MGFNQWDFEREDKPKQDIISIRLNEQDRRNLDDLKKKVGVKSDAGALKIGLLLGYNALQNLFGDAFTSITLKRKRAPKVEK